MAIGLDEALLGWLVASTGDRLARWLRDDPVRATLRKVVKEAVAATAGELLSGNDDDQVEHLRVSLLARDLPVGDEQFRVTSRRELRDALYRWTAALDRSEFGGPGYLSGLGVDAGVLAEVLASRLVDGIERSGRGGGPLSALAEWMWRDSVSADLADVRRTMAELADVERKSGRGALLASAASTDGWLRTSDYIEVVRNIAPCSGLVDREAELNELASFSLGDEPYLWWQGEPWAGKSALMSTFVLNPPVDVEIVSFFITGRVASESDSDAFAKEMLKQLGQVPEDHASQTPGRTVGDRRLQGLLAAAARAAQAAGRRLVLVVDGLDEDHGAVPGSRLPSIASLLPKVPAPGLRIIVASRPDPPLPSDVAADHPLRSCQVRRLTPSPHAAGIARQARRELDELLTGEPICRDVLGLIAAGGGGLSLDDLEQLTGHPRDKLERLLPGAFGRTVGTRLDLSRPDATPGLHFTHETLRVEAAGRLGRATSNYRKKIQAWATSYKSSGWPEETPGYLLRDYTRALAANSDVEQLFALATDRARQDRLLWLTGGDSAALEEIASAERLVLEGSEPDLSTLLRLAIDRERLTRRNEKIPAALPLLWANLGYPARGEAMALADRSHNRESSTLRLAQHFHRRGEYDRAARLASASYQAAKPSSSTANAAQLVLIDALVARGEYDQAEHVARDGVATLLTLPLQHLLGALTAVGQHDRAERLTEAESNHRTRLLSALAIALAGVGEQDRAIKVAHKIDNIYHRDSCLVQIIRVLVQAGSPALAVRLVAGLADERSRDRMTAGLAEALLDNNEPAQAAHVAEHSDDLWTRQVAVAADAMTLATAGAYRQAVAGATNIRRSGLQVRTLTAIVGLAARAHQGADVVGAVTAAAQQAIQHRLALCLRDEAVGALVDTLMQAGALDHAEQVAATITNPSYQVAAMSKLVRAAGSRGDARRSSALAVRARTSVGAILPEMRRAQAHADLTASLAEALVAAGHLHQAEQAVRHIDIERVRTDAAKSVIRGIVAAGKIDQAECFARDIDNRPKLAGSLLAETVKVLAEVGEIDQAELLARRIGHWSERDKALQAVLLSHAGFGAYDKALSIVPAITSTRSRAESLVDLAQAQDTAGHRTRAVQIAAEAERIAKSPSPYQLGWMLTDVCRALIAAGEFDRASEVVGLIDQPLNRVHRLANEISVSLAARDYDRAVSLAGTASTVLASLPKSDGYLPGTSGPAEAVGLLREAIGELVRDLLAHGDRDRAERTASAMADQAIRTGAQAALVEGLVAAGDTDGAERVAREATGDDRRDGYHVFAVLRPVIRAVAAAGGHARVAELIALVEDAVSFLAPGRVPAPWLFRLLWLLGEVGELPVAEEFLTAVPEPYRTRARGALAVGLVANGDLEAAAACRDSPDLRRDLDDALTTALLRSAAGGQHERAEKIVCQISDPASDHGRLAPTHARSLTPGIPRAPGDCSPQQSPPFRPLPSSPRRTLLPR